MKKTFFKKPIALILIISFIIPNIFLAYPQRASAVLGVGDIVSDPWHTAMTKAKTAWDKAEHYVEKFASAAARLLARALLQVIIQDTINWINSGFQGSPAFMTNPQGMLANVADRAVGQFIFEDPDLKFLCDPFQLQVKINLGMNYSYGQNIGCTMSGVLGNIQGAYDDFVGGDFIGGGGWDSWMQMASNPQNTPQGASMMAESALQVKLSTAEKTTTLESNWGAGSLSLKKCKEATYDLVKDSNSPGGYTKTLSGARTFVGNPGYATGTSVTATHANVANSTGGNTIVDQQVERTCETTTPGAVISEGLKVSEWSWVGSSQLAAELSDGINAILGAFATQLVKMTLSKVKGGIFGSDKNSNVDYMAQLDQQMSEAQSRLDAQTQSAEDRAGNATGDTSGVNSGDPFVTRKNNAKNQINNLIDINNAYQKTYSDIRTVLLNAKTELEIAKKCAQDHNLGGSDINNSRAGLIQSSLLDKITNANSTNIVVPPTISQIDNRLQTIGDNISSLNALLLAINSASTEEAIDAEMTKSYNPAKISTDAIVPISNLKTDTQTWLTTNSKNLSDDICPINPVVWSN